MRYNCHKVCLDYLIKFSDLANWECSEEQFECQGGESKCGNLCNADQPKPKCLSLTQKCNEYEDCMDGSDEFPSLCGKMSKSPIVLLRAEIQNKLHF